ncbi:hypothetical protein LTR15_012779 [Elasticomyces elasticus]|nr:hypothetical protein LTR15_012779 [Elasticomyces elasticus]
MTKTRHHGSATPLLQDKPSPSSTPRSAAYAQTFRLDSEEEEMVLRAREESARALRRTDRPITTPRVRRRLEFEQDAVAAEEMAERMRRNNPIRPRREVNTGDRADPDVGTVRRDIDTFTGRADRLLLMV